MKIRINGNEQEVPEGITVSALLESIGESPKGTAVAVADTLVPRTAWEQHILSPGDDVVIIKAAYGG